MHLHPKRDLSILLHHPSTWGGSQAASRHALPLPLPLLCFCIEAKWHRGNPWCVRMTCWSGMSGFRVVNDVHSLVPPR